MDRPIFAPKVEDAIRHRSWHPQGGEDRWLRQWNGTEDQTEDGSDRRAPLNVLDSEDLRKGLNNHREIYVCLRHLIHVVSQSI